MPRYAVYLTRTVTEYVTHYCDAESPDEAGEAALAVADELDWQTDFDAYGGTEIAAIDTLQ